MADAEARERNWSALVTHLLDAPGHLTPEIRGAVFTGEGVPPDLAGFVDTVKLHAYRVTDRQVDELGRAGYSEDQLFEAAVVAAMAAGDRRLRIARRAMGGH